MIREILGHLGEPESPPHLQSGRLRALGVTTARPSSLAADLPSVEESLGLRDFDLAA